MAGAGQGPVFRHEACIHGGVWRGRGSRRDRQHMKSRKSGDKMARCARTEAAIADGQGQPLRLALRFFLLAFPLFVLSWTQAFAQPMQLSPRSLDSAPLAEPELAQPVM